MLAAGSLIGSRYRLTSLIGEGGMASVWRADDDTLKRAVAIKLLYLAPQRDPRASIEQFLREARIAAAVQHRNVIHTVDFGTNDEGIPYMVMELLQGENLAARMERPPTLELEELARIVELTLRGLSAVHAAGIVHRDLKPQNIFLHQDADAVYPKILDFGISRSLGSSELSSPIATQQGLIFGTPHYMAPEQARGEAHIDRRADIYAMGAILYEGITGRPPFDAPTTHELLVKILSSEPIPLTELRPDVPELLAYCVTQAMARDREQRFVDAKAFRRALLVALERAFPGSGLLRLSEVPRRHERQQEPQPLPVVDSLLEAPLGNDGALSALSTWGDFEGLGREREAVGAVAPGRVVRTSASQPPLVAAGGRVQAEPAAPRATPREAARALPEPAVARMTPREAAVRPRISHAQPEPSQENFTQESGPLFGDSPLDGFVGLDSAELELAVAVAPSPLRSSRKPPAKVEREVTISERPRPGRHVSAWWIVPAALVILLLLFLIAPGLISPAPPDAQAAAAREAHNPATAGSTRKLVRARGPESGESRGSTGALRELFE